MENLELLVRAALHAWPMWAIPLAGGGIYSIVTRHR
jgi:hypothetical protein